jgi:hypothetical protein
MGLRVERQASKDLDKKKKKAIKDRDASDRQPSKRRAAEPGFGFTDTVEATQDVEGLTYHPRTVETREVYEVILSSVHGVLGDQAQDVIRNTADILLETLKNDNMKDYDKGVERDWSCKASSPYANNNVPRRNSLQRIVFYSGQRIVLPTPSGALLDLIMCISQGP